MQTDARMRAVVEGGGQRALAASHGVAVEGGIRQYSSSQPNQQNAQQMGAVANLLAGGVAGAVGKTCTAPLARLTILFQVGPSLALSSHVFGHFLFDR